MHRNSSYNASLTSSLDRQTSYDADELQNLINMHERSGQPFDTNKPKAHWKKASDAVHCANTITCNKKFSMMDRKRNCRMCGNVFCRQCTEYQKRLSNIGIPDPTGRLHSVCALCFGAESQKVGQIGTETETFFMYRDKWVRHLNEVKMKAQQNVKANPARLHDRRIEYSEECLRLTEGFRSNRNFIKMALTEVVGKVPDWQKSRHWFRYEKIPDCTICNKTFSKLSRKIHCRVCSKLCCSKCINEELLIYIDEEGDSKWGINGTVAFSVKPSKYCLLFICTHCKPHLEQLMLEIMKKEEELEVLMEEEEESITFFDELIPVQRRLWTMQSDISLWLPKFTADVEVYTSPETSTKSVGLNNLAKCNIDLSDTFSKMSVTSQKLRIMKPTTRGEAVVLNNCIKGTLLFYSENMYLFRKTLKSLADYAPTGVLDKLQVIINEITTRNVLAVCKSICYNIILLQDKYSIEDAAIKILAQLVQSLEDDFRLALKQGKSGEDFGEMIKDIDEMVQMELKGRRRIREPRSKSSYAVFRQCVAPLRSCRRELDAKTSKKDFVQSKGMLEVLLEAKSSPFRIT